jgi:predicted RNase H-like HicB family nuclease
MNRNLQTKDQSFTMIVEQDPESGWLVGEIVELPGCMTQAPDLASLDKNIKEAISLYLEKEDVEEERPIFIGTWRIPMPA